MVESIKLLDVLEANLDEIAAHWAADVKKDAARIDTSDIYIIRGILITPFPYPLRHR